MVKKKIIKKLCKFFLPLLVIVCFVCVLFVNADSLIYQSNPFIIQGTATDNGESIADVSPVAFLFEKRGHSEVVNDDIVDANGQYLYNIGRQQWNEEVELGYIDVQTGNLSTSSDYIRSSDFTRVIPSTDYYLYVGYQPSGTSINLVLCWYDSSFNYISYVGGHSIHYTSPSNACYFKFYISNSLYGVEYRNDITISLYYEDEDGYEQYYPYEVVSYVDTGNELLRSVGNVYDYKTPDGTITRSVGSVYLSSLDWSYVTYGGKSYFIFTIADKKVGDNIISNCPYIFGGNAQVENFVNGYFYTSLYNSTIYVYDTSISTVSDLQTKLGDSVLNYELATPTTEQGTSYSQNYYVDDFGSQYWLDEDMNYVEVGQAGLYGYNFDFVYSWYDNILRMIVVPIQRLGGSIVQYVKDGFVQLFVQQEVVDNVVVYHASSIAWFTFALMGIALAMSLTYFVVNLLRRSK